MSRRGPFTVADLNPKGELQLTAEYHYQQLEQVPGAAELLGQFAGQIAQNPEFFEVPLADGSLGMSFRWRSSAPSAGIGTLRGDGELISLSLLASGLYADADRITLEAFQRHLLREWRDTGIEPAFGLLDLPQRPLVATINFHSPADYRRQLIAALCDRCFAASYFRHLSLA